MPQPVTSPFNARSTALEVVAGHDLSGKTAIVTGGASGIGVETARALASAGAEVILAVRDVAKGNTVAAELRQSTGNPRITAAALDLGVAASIRDFAAAFAAHHPALHLLVNNAGIMATPPSYTPAGYELQFATNHLGHFLLTSLLLPHLEAGAPARVVALSSIGHRRSPVVFDDIHFRDRPYDKWAAYGQSKTANALFAVGLTARYGERGITANAVHPGGIMTGLQKHMERAEMEMMGWYQPDGTLNPIFKTVEQGAATSVWAAVGSELAGIGGRYLEDCKEALPWNEEKRTGVLPHAIDPEAADHLWGVSETLVAAL